MTGRLPDRPVGVRRDWRKVTPDLAELGERLRRCSWTVEPAWGDPIEAAEYRHPGGRLRRVEALFANGRRVSISYLKRGGRIERLRQAP